MRSSYKALAALCSLALSVNTGCNGGSTSSGDIPGNDSAPLSVGDTSDTSDTEVSGTFHTVTDKELSPSTESASAVSFTADGAECTGKGVSASGSTVTITEPGSYSVSGSCNDGQLIINCSKDDDVYLVLNGLSLTCPDGPAILCEQADKLTITLNSSSVNTLSDGSEYTAESGEDTGAALFSRDTLIINGTGSLVVNGVYKDGIKSKDGLKLCGGNITVNSAEDGLVGKDYVLAAAGNVTINSGLDGLKSTNTTDAQKGYISVIGGKYDITCGNDGIQAESALSISDGEINIVSGGGSETVEHLPEQQGGFGRGQRGDQFTDGSEPFDFSNMTNSDGSSADSMKGIKSNGTITVSGGIINANCADDAVHSDGNVTISGGKLNLSTGDDGIHAGSVLTINNGEINITESYEGLEAPGIEIIGGTISLMASDDGINAGSSTAETGFTPYITISGGSITAKATAGKITLRDVIAEETLSAQNISGGVALEGCDGGTIRISCTSGSVKGALLSDKIFLTDSGSGSIRVPRSTEGGTCEITTTSGSIRIDIVTETSSRCGATTFGGINA